MIYLMAILFFVGIILVVPFILLRFILITQKTWLKILLSIFIIVYVGIASVILHSGSLDSSGDPIAFWTGWGAALVIVGLYFTALFAIYTQPLWLKIASLVIVFAMGGYDLGGIPGIVIGLVIASILSFIPRLGEISQYPRRLYNTVGHWYGFDSRGPVNRDILIVVLVILTGLAVLNRVIGNSGFQGQLAQNTKKAELATQSELNLSEGIFAKYEEIKSSIKPSLQSYTLTSSELSNLSAIGSNAKVNFSSPQLSALESSGFFTQASKPVIQDINTPVGYGKRTDDMIDLYTQFQGDFPKEFRKPENTVFISSDFLLHIYHVLIDRSFQKIEAATLQPKLKQLTSALFEDSLQRYQKEQNPKLKESLKRLTSFYLVPLVILDTSLVKPAKGTTYDTSNQKQQDLQYIKDDETIDTPANIQAKLDSYSAKVPSEIIQISKQELTKVLEAKEVGASPLYSPIKSDYKEDYTQYNARSHYTKNSALRSYFKAMIWYGRHGFDAESLDLTRDSLVMTWQLGAVTIDGLKASKIWESIYLPTVFFVGKSDDLTVYEYKDVLNQVYGSTVNYSALADESKLGQFQTEVKKLPGPKILSEIRIFDPAKAPTKDELLQKTKSFRFMGQRFNPDGYILSSLTQGDEKPDPETNQRLPSTPTALMVMSVLGSKTADNLLNDWVRANAPESDKVILKVKNQLVTQFSKYDTKTWTQNIYWAWLYNLLPLLQDHGQGYPMFMQNTAWSKKDLNAALGSWTELRHDTLLYAKPSYAELGGGGPEGEVPPVPKGYVEPNLDFMTRLMALNKMTSDGLSAFGLINDEQKNRFQGFGEALDFYKKIAEKELSNQTITDDEYEDLRVSVGRKIKHLLDPFNGEELTERDARAALIADIHTDAKKNQILYEATGVPFVIYVAVKDQGGTRLTRGVAYSYFEFAEPLGTRLNDEAWQQRVYTENSQTPPLPTWVQELTIK